MGNLPWDLSLQGGNSGNNGPEILPPPAIAYRVDSSFILAQLTPEANLGELIGLQIEFKSNAGNLSNPIIAQLYFKKTSTSDNFYFYKKYTNSQLTSAQSRPVVVDTDGDDGQELSQLGESQIIVGGTSKVYTGLDFYTDDVDFVYFPIEHLITLTHLYQKMIISGCKVNLGRKLMHNQPGSVLQAPYPPCFSLKIEGSELNLLRASIGNMPSGNEAKGSNYIVGHPCPPTWESFIAVFASRMGRYADSQSREKFLEQLPYIWKSWNNPRVVHPKPGRKP